MADSDYSTSEKRQAHDVRQSSIPQSDSTPTVATLKTNVPLQRRVKEAARNLYQSTVVELILRRKHIVASKDGRHIPLSIEHAETLIDTTRGVAYVSNNVRTSRYTVWDFIPKQLFFQFSRVGNFYFLCVGVPQMVSRRVPRTIQYPPSLLIACPKPAILNCDVQMTDPGLVDNRIVHDHFASSVFRFLDHC